MNTVTKNVISRPLRVAALFAVGVTLIAVPPVTHGNAPSDPAPQKEIETPHHKPQEATVTGCLLRRDKPGDFALTTRDAKLYYIQSSTVDLNAHVRHTVTITGTFLRDKQIKDDPDKSPEAQTISATKLEMIQKTCH